MTNAERQKIREMKARRNVLRIVADPSNNRIRNLKPQYTTYNTLKCKVTILLEDDGYALDVCERLVSNVYPDMTIRLIGAHGEGNLNHIINAIKSDVLIVLFDKSDNIKLVKKIKNGLVEFKKAYPKSRVFAINPECFEEILLSYINFRRLANIKEEVDNEFISQIEKFVHGEIVSCNYMQYALNPLRKTNDKIIEDWIERLTQGTQYECTHSPSYISKCWINECKECADKTENCKQIQLENVGKYVPKSKLELVSLQSLLYGLLKIMDNVLKHHYREPVPKLINEINYIWEVCADATYKNI